MPCGLLQQEKSTVTKAGTDEDPSIMLLVRVSSPAAFRLPSRSSHLESIRIVEMTPVINGSRGYAARVQYGVRV